RYPQVVMFADTIRQLESVASAALVPQREVDLLTSAYRAYRAAAHHRSLAGEGAFASADEFRAERAAVSRIWEDTMGAAPPAVRV
ncbi:MAG TPA: hypothetical protein VKQ31_01770, partial [Steroidobacteraceae bacterium]|nr:hypothetical protein [Steroidobacteraceae bacterium]